MTSLGQLKQSLIERGEATELFAQLRDDGSASLLGNKPPTDSEYACVTRADSCSYYSTGCSAKPFHSAS